MSRGTRILYNGNFSVLQDLLVDTANLKSAYTTSRKDQGRQADTAIVRISAFLQDDEVQGCLNREFERVRYSLVPPQFTDVPKSLMEAEERLGSHYGFSSRAVREYVKKAYDIADPYDVTKSISNCDQLGRSIRAAHATLSSRLASEPVRLVHRLGHKRKVEEDADVLCFAIGVLVADALQRNAFHLSYFVATSHLFRIVS